RAPSFLVFVSRSSQHEADTIYVHRLRAQGRGNCDGNRGDGRIYIHHQAVLVSRLKLFKFLIVKRTLDARYRYFSNSRSNHRCEGAAIWARQADGYIPRR
ncbi:unnamed protein product, partial [Scytosiphon promiscuus]